MSSIKNTLNYLQHLKYQLKEILRRCSVMNKKLRALFYIIVGILFAFEVYCLLTDSKYTLLITSLLLFTLALSYWLDTRN